MICDSRETQAMDVEDDWKKDDWTKRAGTMPALLVLPPVTATFRVNSFCARKAERSTGLQSIFIGYISRDISVLF